MITETEPNDELKEQVRQLAQEAFDRHLISGHGHGQYKNEYQIVIEGKPRHYKYQEAYSLLKNILQNKGLK
ncbi:hypothetical protein STA3757_02470 [Stanieria sp. NIES-3757]|nr:hypothetical protein STA3757_02470 [Stanieria sp. NIES-3757]